MNFNLWMFYDALKEFDPEIIINSSADYDIENIRLRSPEMALKSNTLYVEKSDVFFNDGDEKIVCLHGKNYIRLNTTSLNSVYNTIFVFWEETQNWFNNINFMISNNCMLKDVLGEFRPHLPFPIMVLDSSQVALAITEDYGLGTMDSTWDKMITSGSFGVDVIAKYNEKYNDLITTREYYELPGDPFPYPSYNHNIFINNEFMGFLTLIIKDTELTEAHKAWFRIAYQFVSRWMDLYAGQNDLLIKTAFFKELLSENFQHIERFKAALLTQGWSSGCDKRLVVLSCVSNKINMHEHIIKIINSKTSLMYAIEHQNSIVVLVNCEQLFEKEMLEVIKPIALSTGYYGGMSDIFTTFEDISHYLMQARLPMFNGHPDVGDIESCHKYIIPYMMELLSQNTHMNLTHPALATLREYDEAKNNEYYHLLYKYLLCECNQTMAANQLSMHRSSLIRKINNICEMTNIDLDDYTTRLHLLISYEYERYKPWGRS